MSEGLPKVSFSSLATPVLKSYLSNDAECSFIGMEDVSEGGRIINRRQRNTAHSAGYTAFRENDVLFAKITPCMENGKGALAQSLVGGVGFGSTEFHVLRANKNSDPRFINQWTKSPLFRAQAETMMTGSAGQRRVPRSFFSVFQVPLLPLAEQRKIAEILDTVDENIRSTERLIAKLEQAKQGMVWILLAQGIDESGGVRDSGKSPEQFVRTSLGELPKDWQVVRLARISQIITSGSRNWGSSYSHSGAILLRVGNLTRRHINLRLNEVARVSPSQRGEADRTAVLPGDLMISITADLGIVGVAPSGLGESYVNQHVALVRIDPQSAEGRWSAHFLSGFQSQQRIRSMDDPGAKSGLNLPAVGRLLVAIPKLRSEARKITEILDENDRGIQSAGNQLAKLRKVKQGLMEDLLTGRVRVNVDEAA